MNIDYIEVLWADVWYLVPAALIDNLRRYGLETRESSTERTCR